MEYALKTSALTKKYGAKSAVDEVNMTIRKGDVYGFVGKNGAGKTTLIRLILGLARPTSGSFQFFDGMDINEARHKTGSLIETPAIYPNMTASQNLAASCKMLGINEAVIPETLDRVGLGDVGKKKARDFSLGMKQRLGIALALIGDPEFLVLDEPINGLDPEGIVEVRDLILSLNRDHGKTVLISSHILGELSKISTRYGIINSGKLVDEISHEELLKKCTTSTVIKTSDPQKAKETVAALLSDKGMGDASSITIDPNGSLIINVTIDDKASIAKALFNNNIIVESLSEKSGELEDYFIERMGAGNN